MAHPEITVHVLARYLPEQSAPQQQVWAFAYTVTAQNTGDVAAQVIGRHWLITDSAGGTQEVRGLGIVGQQPLLQPGETHEYTSWTRLAAPSGSMRGSFLCVTDAAEPFEAPIAPFDLSQAGSL